MKLYGIWKKSKLASGFRRRLYDQMALYYPMQEEVIEDKTVRVALGTLLLLIMAGLFLILLGSRKPVYLFLDLIILILVGGNWIAGYFQRQEMKLNRQLLAYLRRLGNIYSGSKDVERALTEARDPKDKEMTNHSYLLSDLLASTDESEAWNQVRKQYRNRPGASSVSELYMVCQLAYKYGNTLINKEDSIILNINYIKENLRQLILYKEKKDREYFLLGWMALLPYFAMGIVQRWACSVTEGICEYYQGGMGLAASLLVFISVAAAYEVISLGHYPRERWGGIYESREKNESGAGGKATEGFHKWLEARAYGNYGKSLLFSKYLREAGRKGDPVIFWESLLIFGGLGILMGVFLAVQFPAGRWGLGLALLGGLLGGLLGLLFPWAGLLMDHNAFANRRKQEVYILQTVALMLVGQPGMSVGRVLDNMKEFTLCFNDLLTELTDEFRSRGFMAFQRVKQKESNPQLQHLASCFMSCDRVPMDQAFGDLEQERAYYSKCLDEERDYDLRNQAALGRVLAFLPLSALVIVKLVLPFVLEGMELLGSY